MLCFLLNLYKYKKQVQKIYFCSKLNFSTFHKKHIVVLCHMNYIFCFQLDLWYITVVTHTSHLQFTLISVGNFPNYSLLITLSYFYRCIVGIFTQLLKFCLHAYLFLNYTRFSRVRCLERPRKARPCTWNSFQCKDNRQVAVTNDRHLENWFCLYYINACT